MENKEVKIRIKSDDPIKKYKVDKRKSGYCVECGKKLIMFRNTNDWEDRKLHKQCWKMRNDLWKLGRLVDKDFSNKDKYDTFTGLKLNN